MELEQKISFFRHHDREFVSKNEIVESTSDLVPFYRLIRIFSLRAGQGSERFARRGRRQSVGPRRGSPHVLRRPRRITLTANVNTPLILNKPRESCHCVWIFSTAGRSFITRPIIMFSITGR